MKKRESGFTLIELLIVIAIIVGTAVGVSAAVVGGDQCGTHRRVRQRVGEMAGLAAR